LGIKPNIVVSNDFSANSSTGIITGFTTLCGVVTPPDATYRATRVRGFTFALVAYL
jgi:hypothetical protein